MNYIQGNFDRNEVLSMEEDLVTSIGSFMYPTTAGTFVLMLLNEFSCASSSKLAVLETCQFMIELATCGENPSSIIYSSKERSAVESLTLIKIRSRYVFLCL